MNIIILGKAGSGKGVQSGILAKKFGLEHLDMGRTLRDFSQKEDAIGKEIYDIQNVKKTLVSNRILKEVLHLKIGSFRSEQGIIFDGVPRTLEQERYLEETLQEFGRKVDKVFFIDISEAESIRRISRRWNCPQCGKILIMGKDLKKEGDACPFCQGKIERRKDDTPEGIKKRLEVFQKETMPVLEYFRQKGVLVEVDGEKTIEEVSQEILKKVQNLI
jgi:adenylate kinase